MDAEELYDHAVDALERYNLASQPGSAAVLEDIHPCSGLSIRASE